MILRIRTISIGGTKFKSELGTEGGLALGYLLVLPQVQGSQTSSAVHLPSLGAPQNATLHFSPESFETVPSGDRSNWLARASLRWIPAQEITFYQRRWLELAYHTGSSWLRSRCLDRLGLRVRPLSRYQIIGLPSANATPRVFQLPRLPRAIWDNGNSVSPVNGRE